MIDVFLYYSDGQVMRKTENSTFFILFFAEYKSRRQQNKQHNRTMMQIRSKVPINPRKQNHTLSNSKLLANTHQLRQSPSKLQSLARLFHRYKSNVNILKTSPYYTNRQEQKQLVSYLATHKHTLPAEQLQKIQKHYELDANTAKMLEGQKISQYRIKLSAMNAAKDISVYARSIAQLQSKLKIQHAIVQYQTTAHTTLTSTIIGFETQQGHPVIDYLLSLRSQQLKQGFYPLKPIFKALPTKKIKLHNFKLVRCLGTGGFSLVFLVRDQWSSEYFALKLIDKKNIIQSQRETIVQNERYVLGELKSPFTTSLKYCFETLNHFAFVVQYCPGGELFNRLKQVKRMSEEQAKFYFLQILVGLDYIHQNGILYRDIKPQNLLIAADGHVKIADFGLAKPLARTKTSYSFCGSPQYMAPQMLNKQGHSFTLDYYCLGALLYQLVIGVPPYYSLNHQEIYQGILHQQLSFPSHTPLSKQLQNLLRGLLQKNPNQRLGKLFGIQQILIHPWIGKISRKTIQQKQLTPPYLPDLNCFNFDESELKQRLQEMIGRIDADMKTTKFDNFFSEQFYYQHSKITKRSQSKLMRIRRSKKKLSNTKQSLGRKNSQTKTQRNFSCNTATC